MVSTPTMRAFCALNLDVATTRSLVVAAAALRARPDAPEASWVPPTRLHVTLQFLGDVDVGLAPALRDALAPLAEVAAVGRVGFTAFEGFPDGERARVVVAGIDDAAGSIAAVARRVADATGGLGIERESRTFRPHVTLARLSHALDVRGWLRSVIPPSHGASMTELVLYRSDFTSAGHEYAAIARFDLARSPRRSLTA